ncbi:hypothetical protein HR45_09775 [Shewanella mangrovi]|uniref:DUF3261 domain-containing protein n=1 Tax=Shewanella mangrovi TaxID=1515746 RepID=A0A094JZ27_9GAMM|nr:DUF3261 domain-containing protein [Shewanella mangrovi]KFZ37696.1 hypothetical protein HR45_09775 [Shewanella mangrovi]
MSRMILILIVMLLSGCQQLRQSQHSCITLAADVNQCLAPLPWQHSAPPADELTQLVTLKRYDKQQQLTMSLALTPQNMTIIGLAPLGQALFTLQFDGHTLSSEQSMLLGEQFRADYLVAMLQLVYWPQAALQQAISGAELSEQQCGKALCRQLRRDDKLIASVEYQQSDKWHSQAVLTLPQADVRLTINPL